MSRLHKAAFLLEKKVDSSLVVLAKTFVTLMFPIFERMLYHMEFLVESFLNVNKVTPFCSFQ